MPGQCMSVWPLADFSAIVTTQENHSEKGTERCHLGRYIARTRIGEFLTKAADLIRLKQTFKIALKWSFFIWDFSDWVLHILDIFGYGQQYSLWTHKGSTYLKHTSLCTYLSWGNKGASLLTLWRDQLDGNHVDRLTLRVHSHWVLLLVYGRLTAVPTHRFQHHTVREESTPCRTLLPAHTTTTQSVPSTARVQDEAICPVLSWQCAENNCPEQCHCTRCDWALILNSGQI